MWERIEIAREDSDVALFHDLLYMGEMVTKVVTAGLVAALADDRDRHRYRQLHRLVRADSLGEWTGVMDEVLTGPASQFLLTEALQEAKELTQKVGSGSWQYEAVELLTQCYSECYRLMDGLETVPLKVDGRRWFKVFVALRNKTRGHGAPSGHVLGLCVLSLRFPFV